MEKQQQRSSQKEQKLKKPPLVDIIQTEIEERGVDTDEKILVLDADDDLDYQERHSQILLLQLSVSERQDVLSMRKLWAAIFLVVVVLILVFEIGITVAVGMRLLQFSDEWFLRIIVLGGIAQILAMPYLVTQFLFDKNK
jgi:uncharacterized integral membrane protein